MNPTDIPALGEEGGEARPEDGGSSPFADDWGSGIPDEAYLVPDEWEPAEPPLSAEESPVANTGVAAEPPDPSEPAPEPEVIEAFPEFPPEAFVPQPVTGVARWLWIGGILFLAIATVLALIPPIRRAIPFVGDAVDSAASWIGDTAVTGVADAWRDSTGSLERMADSIPARQIDEQRQLEGSDSLLIVATDDSGAGVVFALLASSPEGDALLTVIPPALFGIVPGYGDFRLSRAPVFEDPELAGLTLTNLLGIRIDDVLHLGPGDITAAVGGPLVVDLPNSLLISDGSGGTAVAASAGSARREAEGVEVILTTQGSGDQFEWLQRQVAVWKAIFAEAAGDAALPERLAAYAGLDPIGATGLLAKAAPIVAVTVLPATPVSGTGTAEGFVLGSAAAEQFVATRIDHLRIREGVRPRVEILNGNGLVLTTRTVATTLVRRGFRIIKTDNADNFDYETTLVIAQGREHQREAEEVIGHLGTGDLLLELRAPSGVVDISIIVGLDIPAGEG
jgi:hypothetical protein